MRRILWVGNPFFSGELRSCGWEIARAINFEKPEIWSWRKLVETAGFEPDVLVVADKSSPPFVLGMEDFPCLTVFYGVDTHIHSWEGLYAQGFDAALVSLSGHMDRFVGPFLPRERVWNSPPYSPDADRPDPDAAKTWDCLFVGTQNEELMPKREAFLREFAALVPGFHAQHGSYRTLFPRGKTLINQAEGDDLNFRVFEALGCGGCLVTPRVGHGLEKFFVDGEHLSCYEPGNAKDAARRVNFLLEHPEIRERIARAGYEEVSARHRASHRAQTFTKNIRELAKGGKTELIERRQSLAQAIRRESLSFPYLLWAKESLQPELRRAYLAAAKGQFGLEGRTEN